MGKTGRKDGKEGEGGLAGNQPCLPQSGAAQRDSGINFSHVAIYERIKAWDRCHELCLAVYSVTKTWPTEANIAEGCAKRGANEFRRYLDISLGSLSELAYTLMLARDLKILGQDEWLQLDELHRKAGGMTWLLYKSLLAKKVTTPDPR